MNEDRQSHQQSKNVLSALFVVICIGSLIFYWVMAPESLYHTLGACMLSYLVLWSVGFLWSDTSNTEKAKRFFLTTGSIVITVGVIELLVLVRVFDFRILFGTEISEPWRHPDNLNDPRLLHIHKPYDRLVWQGIEYKYDRDGFRNGTDLESAHLIVLGDSFVEGWNVHADQLLTTQLARKLNRPVANLGQSWYGPQQELEVLRRYGVELAPKVCVWVFFEGNDLADLRRYKEATQDWELYSNDFHSFRQRSFTKNATIALNSVHTQKIPWWMTPPKGKDGIFTSPSGQKVRLYFNYKGHHLSENDPIALEELPFILKQAQTLCHSVDAKFLMVFAPTKFRVYNKFTEFESHVQPRYWVINDLPQKVEVIVQEELPHGKFLNLTEVFIEEAKQGSLLYLDSDSHWSADGHRVAASAIANSLEPWE